MAGETAGLKSLIIYLRNDGFSRVYCLAPSGLDPQSTFILQHSAVMGAQRFLPSDNEHGKVILMPIGHTEQHGFHLPLSVNTIIIDSIAKGTVAKVPTRCWAMPVMPHGVSTHRSSFAATMNAGRKFCATAFLHTSDRIGSEMIPKYRTSEIGRLWLEAGIDEKADHVDYFIYLRIIMNAISEVKSGRATIQASFALQLASNKSRYTPCQVSNG
jgi:hypothetical protein